MKSKSIFSNVLNNELTKSKKWPPVAPMTSFLVLDFIKAGGIGRATRLGVFLSQLFML